MKKIILSFGLILCLFLLSGCGNKCAGMSYSDAVSIASSSNCVEEGSLTEEYSCNEISKTWWIDLDIDKENCNPACVVNAETREAEINWRCAGVTQLTGGVIKITGGEGDELSFEQ